MGSSEKRRMRRAGDRPARHHGVYYASPSFLPSLPHLWFHPLSYSCPADLIPGQSGKNSLNKSLVLHVLAIRDGCVPARGMLNL